MEHMERRRSQDATFDAVFAKLDKLTDTVSNNHMDMVERLGKIDTAFQVHVAEDKAMADDVADHKERWKEVDKWKGKGLLIALGALLSTGALGAWGKEAFQAVRGMFE